MQLTHLSLTHFRNYRQVDLDFTRPFTLLQGMNAQGKTNLLEAIYYLATSKPVHAQSEREVVDWHAQEEPIPYSRIAAHISPNGEVDGRPQKIEIILTPKGDSLNYKKQVKINGVPRRSLDLIGLMRTVLFLPEDTKLVDGSPGERRRYLDVALCQIDREYTRALSRFQKILTQRNSLLKTLRERNASPTDGSTDAQLSFWDEQLVAHGGLVAARRHNFLLQLEPLARARHKELTAGNETLQLHYLPSFNPGHLSEDEFAQLKSNHPTIHYPQIPAIPLAAADVAQNFLHKLQSRRGREIAAGLTLYGPHRDDLRFLANGRDLRTYGSRGQQRTGALALKLAEVAAMTTATGTPPLLLLDDVMSELDELRRTALLTALHGVEQAVLTTTDWDDFTSDFRHQALRLQVTSGMVQTLE